MVHTGVPNQIWDDALDFKAYVRSNTALDIYILQGDAPENVILRGTSDTNQFCEHGFYDWVMFKDEPIQCPHKNLVLGRYLGPDIDVGTAMTSNTMKGNGEVLHRST